jgi:fumarylacetoacetate (FAA) hydrolase
MKLVTYTLSQEHAKLQLAALAANAAPISIDTGQPSPPGASQSSPTWRFGTLPSLPGRPGALHGNLVIDLATAFEWALRHAPVALPYGMSPSSPPTTLLDLLRLGPRALESARQVVGALAALSSEQLLEVQPRLAHRQSEVRLHAPIPEPPSVRDFYAFEQHVKTARAKRNLGMIPEWYEIPVFYFSNPAAIYGPDDQIAYPKGTEWLDFELEIACIIGKAGRDIPVEEAASYIAGYTIMNDWSARDLQRKEMLMSLGPAKGKDFATSLGPWLVTPDELISKRSGSGVSERHDLTMLARVNGQELSRGNFKDIFYSFPQIIAHASMNVWLKPGDVIGSGTVGTGCLLELTPPPDAPSAPGSPISRQHLRWLQRGDVVEMEIDGLGILRNTIT